MMMKDKAYWILTAVLLMLGGGLLIFSPAGKPDEVPPAELFRAMHDSSRFMCTDEVTRRIIEEDPSLLLIDVRNPESYRSFSLPGAINIPLTDLLLPEWGDYLRAPGMEKVLYSNDDIMAGQAWILCTRLGITDLYIMRGGLNLWADHILTPEAPPETASMELTDRYRFRLGARLYFTGGTGTGVSATQAEPIPVVRREKKTTIQGGC
ncbi:MAG TPA: rhodanese-like domain-containing protein [Bacteroidetes bacterium]|nr:rhodanese-like domain-containing protein [Bacteroidota bacterium]